MAQGVLLRRESGVGPGEKALTHPQYPRSPECDCCLCIPGSGKGPASHNPSVLFRECVICERSCPEIYGNIGRLAFTCADCFQFFSTLK